MITFTPNATDQPRAGIYGDATFFNSSVVEGNTITIPGPTVGESTGIYWRPYSGAAGDNLLVNNVIIRENGADGFFKGIELRSSSSDVGEVLIANNTIVSRYSDPASSIYFHGVNIYRNDNTRIENNIIIAGTEDRDIGVYYNQDNQYDGLATLRNNYIEATEALYLSSPWLQKLTTAGEINDADNVTYDGDSDGTGDGVAGGNVTGLSPAFADLAGGDLRLTASTPAAITGGARDLSSDGFSTDADGNGRTLPWSIGAFEY